jgi:DNA polymerase III subunit epsilon
VSGFAARQKHDATGSFGPRSLRIVPHSIQHPGAAHVLADTAVILDFETTGLECGEGHRVTEVAALRIRDGVIIERFTSLVNCGRRIPHHIIAFTGITQRMVDGAPDALAIFQQLLAFIGTDPVIAHNAWFDEGFLRSECRRLGIDVPQLEFLCSYQIARQALPELRSHALGSLTAKLRLPFSPQLHRAAVDVNIVANVVLKICERLQAQSGRAIDVAALRGLMSTSQCAAMASAA